jgi:hypothetical protein
MEKNLAITTWTTSRHVNLREGKLLGSYVLDATNSRITLTDFIFGSGDVKTKHFKGSFMPFAGWEVIEPQSMPASAIVVEQSANDSWTATVWSMQSDFNTSFKFTDRPYMQYWEDAEAWKMVLPIESGRMIISRNSEMFSITVRR